MPELAVEAWQERISAKAFRAYLREQRAFDRRLALILRQGSLQAEATVEALIPDTRISAVLRSVQLSQSSQVLRQQQAQLWAAVRRETQAGIERTSALAAEQYAELVQYLGKRLTDQLMQGFQAAAEHAIENLRSRLVNDIKFSTRVYKNQALAAGKIDEIVNNGLLLNKSAREIARDVRVFISPTTPGGVSYSAMRLGRTELNNAFHTTSVRSAASQPWVDGVRWNLSESHPRPDECNDYADHDDGLGKGIFNPKDVPGKPHPQCLCYTTTVTVSPEDFVKTLMSGGYNGWLRTNGLAPIGAMSA